ncbi:retinitis pigmentosa 1-like 1 protein [Siniperca chuatsi]|uniref:retinitis pigmentosa 1-like 1 protein n=1 Tax=Siniperca chuatsi TaxID=119488 RepID=UPI001CE0F235|nr:retinitis pigmentosa 1-like 1 protein [Siniperca chuatsi]XP_044044428.1 retinitis pigmentosa 1-like 1 protein [Siniperca chuatsi]
MHSVQAGMWDPQPPSKHASHLPTPAPSNLRLAHVTTATPAKRITFYKSGDSQFGGVKMAVHKRSFKCFDALLDDLSQKVPLPFGVRTVTTPRGIHAVKHLEQLQDGGCYLCSDRRQAKPVNMELASKRPSIWHHHSRRPQRPQTSSTTPPGHRQRRILLVKNSEPGMRRSVVLSRRSTRSLVAFLDEVSEVMQFHVRKLYTADGRRIDSVQSLMTCPGVLVCVGREAFSPLLVNFIMKNSEEKLPSLGSRSPGLGPRTPGNGARSPATQGARSPPHGAQSRTSEYSDGHESKKNVNFGLETKKSIIHPRSDSSNRSTRFSLSSEKSYGNGVNTYSQARPSIMNEDIEKRVLVNKDGSLSVEMRVRFRLHNDETLQWSTQIKKSPSLTNECCPLSQAQPHYLQQGQSESCSDPDSASFDPECVDYSNQPLQRSSEGNRCPCCYQRQEQQYDLWENPAHSHKQPPVPPPLTSSHTHTMMRHTHSSSSSSSCNSRRVVRCRAQLSNCGGGSGSEQSHLVQEEMCMTEQVERRVEVEQDGDTHVEVCRVSRCCSRSEVVAMDSNLRPLSRKSVEDELLMEEEGERPLSAVSTSSHVLQSLKEDQDDDLPPSASQCGHSNEPSPTFQTHLNDKPTSNFLAGSNNSTEHKKHEDGEERGSRAVSAASSCHCGAATPHSTAEAEEIHRAPSSMPKMSRGSCRSSKAKIPNSEEEGAADDEDEEIKRVVSGLSGHTELSAGSSSSVCPNCGGCKRGVNSVSNSRALQRSHHSHRASPKPATPLSNQENGNNSSDDDGSDVSAVSTQSNKTNLTNHGRFSAISNVLDGRASSAMSTTSNPEAKGKWEERAPSATSHRSNRSHKSGCNEEEERSPSAMSAQSNLSAKSSKSHKSKCSDTAEAPDIKTRQVAEGENGVERALSSLSAKSGASAKTSASVKLSIKVASPTDNTAVEENDTNKRTPSVLSVKSNASDKPGEAERPDSVLSARSAKSNVSAKSSTSRRSTCSHCLRAVSPGAKAADEPVIEATGQEEGMEAEERAVNAMSAKSNLSVKSNKSHKSTKASERSLSPRSETGRDGEERTASQMSGRSVKSNMSVKSSKSCKSNCNGNEIAASARLRVAEEKENEMVEEETQQRPESVMSAKLENERAASAGSSKSHESNCNENTGANSEIGDNTGGGEKAEDRAASALSGKSASSAKSHHPNCDASSRVASPAKDTAKTEVDSMEDRTPSAISGKSHTSSKSNCTAASPNPNEADVPSIETNRVENQNENQERVFSAMSVKSKSSVRSRTSHISNSSKNLKSVSPSPNVVIIKKTERVDEEENETTVRAPSAASAKSGKSNVSSASKSNHNRTADIAVIKTADADEKVVKDNAPRSKSPEHSQGQMLSPRRTCSPRTHSPKAASPSSPQLPGPSVGLREARGPSALSVHSTTSAKSGRSKCCCGAASALEKAKKEKEGEDKEVEKQEDNEELKSEEASERAASILSSSTKRQRRESGGTEQPPSRNSSGSVSLGLPEDQETADSDSGNSSVSFQINNAMKEDVEGTRSTMSQKSNCNSSKSTLSHNPLAIEIPTIETTRGSEDKSEEGGEQKTERAASTFSAKSSRSSCNCSVKAAAQMLDNKQHTSASPTKAGNDLETSSVKSASTTKASNLDAPDNRTSSAMASASAKVRSKSPASASAKNANVAKTTAGDSANNDTVNQAVSRPASKAKGKEDMADNKVASVLSKSPCCLKPESAASAHSGSKMKASKENKGEEAKCNAGSNSVKTSSSQKKETPIESSSPCPLHSSRPCSKAETCSKSNLFHSLSAADLLKETLAVARPHSQQTKASKTSDKPKSEKSGRCQRSSNQTDQEEELELTPACLPTASPNEVVSDWLRSIPTNGSMLALGDELNEEGGEQENVVDEKLGEEVAKEEETPEDEKVDKKEKVEAEEEEEKEEEAVCDAAEEKSSDPAPGDAVGTSSHPNTLLLRGEFLPRNWHSSAAVMKVLLSSSLGRCQSMPEVSPVYGRRLSTSARGLLDCLAQLQLIDPAVSPCCEQQKDRNQQYEDIMTILQSLWLTEPRNIEAKEAKDIGTEQVTPPRSSSGVDMSTGSGGSGKENGNKGGDETKQNKTKETESLHEDEGAKNVEEEEEEGNAEARHKEIESEPEEISTEHAQTDIAEESVQSEEQSTVPPCLDSPKASENPSSSDKSSANDSSKSPTENERETLEDSSSGTPPAVLRAPLSKRLSQDPDPVWVLHLLKKLEKQFMNHYINAMAEFKVRWDLDDSLILDTMISELREEVSRRIQSSIGREMRKIQSRAGRAGRSPRPPQGGNLSRESTMTEKRRRILKVMKNQSVKTADSLSDGEMTGEFSDQRSDDDYCPCDACVRKKMAARPLKTNPMAAEAPVMMEFDLLKILQLKKSPSPAAVPQPAEEEGDSVVVDEEGRNLEVLQEEEEEDETKEDIKADVVLEETIPEEDEEIGEEEDGGEAGEEEEVGAKEENSMGDEEQEEGERGGEEAGEEETSENGEEEEAAECQCQSARNEEESDKAEEGEGETAEAEDAEETSENTGDDETADDEERAGEEEGENAEDEGEPGDEKETGTEEEEEESDKETVKEATAGEGETTENGKGEEEEEEEAEVEECEEENETTGRESGEEEASGETEDDSATKNEANEESTVAEEFVEGNVSASAEAEDEDDEDDGTGEGESHDNEKGGESEEKEGEASEEERASLQGHGVTEGEEADAEDSDTDKRPSDTSADESGREGPGATGDEEEKEGGDGDEVVEDAVEEFKPEEEEEEVEDEVVVVSRNKREDGALLHQLTRTSVESQPGSLEDINTDSPQNPVNSIEVPKMAAGVSTGGGMGQRRSRSPARVKRRKAKESDVELDNF